MQANADTRGATEDMLSAYKDKPAAPAVPEPEKAPAPAPAAKPAAPAAKVRAHAVLFASSCCTKGRSMV